MENHHRRKMFAYVLPFSVGRAPHDKAMTIQVLLPLGYTPAFPYFNLARQSLRPSSNVIGNSASTENYGSLVTPRDSKADIYLARSRPLHPAEFGGLRRYTKSKHSHAIRELIRHLNLRDMALKLDGRIT
jgi:hypothetical protein